MIPKISIGEFRPASHDNRDAASGQPFRNATMTHQFRRIARSGRADLAQAIALDVDKHGSPVNLEPANWFVCFVPGLRPQWWHRFVHGRRKHVFAIRPEPGGMWTLFEPWWRRLLTASISPEQARRFLAWASAGDVLLVREAIPGRGSQISGWMTCAVPVSFCSAADTGHGHRRASIGGWRASTASMPWACPRSWRSRLMNWRWHRALSSTTMSRAPTCRRSLTQLLSPVA